MAMTFLATGLTAASTARANRYYNNYIHWYNYGKRYGHGYDHGKDQSATTTITAKKRGEHSVSAEQYIEWLGIKIHCSLSLVFEAVDTLPLWLSIEACEGMVGRSSADRAE